MKVFIPVWLCMIMKVVCGSAGGSVCLGEEWTINKAISN